MTEEEKEAHLNSYSVPPEGGPLDPRPILNKLLHEVDRFRFLLDGDAVIWVLMREEPERRLGKTVLGSMRIPGFQGPQNGFGMWLIANACGTVPDYILTLAATPWREGNDRYREALIHHELCHCVHKVDSDGEPKFDDDGRPVFGIQGHDIEEFNDTVARYGKWLPDVEGFAMALKRGGVN